MPPTDGNTNSQKRQQLIAERDYLIASLGDVTTEELPRILARLDVLRYELVGAKRLPRQVPWSNHRAELMTWALYSSVAIAIGQKILDENLPREGKAAIAVRRLTNRVFMSAETMTILRRYADHDWRIDATTVLRTLYDAMLQALYIIDDPENMEFRGELYEGFSAIERYELLRRVEADSSAFSRKLRESPLRKDGEPRLVAEYQQRIGNYRKPGSSIRPRSWYAHSVGTLKDMAVVVGYEDEYLLLTHDLGASVHSSAFALAPKPLFSPDLCLLLAWHLTVRVLGKIADRYEIELAGEESKVVRDAYGNIYNLFERKGDGLAKG